MKDLFRDIVICPFCGMPTKIVWIHGHGQCTYCKNVIDECCRGENQQPGMREETNPSNENEEKNENKKNEKDV